MTEKLAKSATDAIEAAILHGDISKMSGSEKTSYYLKVCESLGLNPMTKPLEFLKLSGREVLYAKKDATDQLRYLRGISLSVVSRETIGDLCIVTARATTPEGRTDEDVGVVSVAGLKGEALSNALMKALTKAKRRVTLSVCGLGFLDESEVESIPHAVTTAPRLPAENEEYVSSLACDEHGEIIEPPHRDYSAIGSVMLELDALTTTDELKAWAAKYKEMISMESDAVRAHMNGLYKAKQQKVTKMENQK